MVERTGFPHAVSGGQGLVISRKRFGWHLLCIAPVGG